VCFNEEKIHSLSTTLFSTRIWPLLRRQLQQLHDAFSLIQVVLLDLMKAEVVEAGDHE
jgi:hypothetical protein